MKQIHQLAGFASQNKLACSVILIGSGVIALWAATRMTIPWYPVPFTMQTVILPILAVIYTRGVAISTVCAYIGLGALGVPVFANPAMAGLAYMAGPTGGYLIGFIPCVAIIAFMLSKRNQPGFFYTLMACCLGVTSIYVCGLFWLWHLGIDVRHGFTPFVQGIEQAKLLISATVIYGLKNYNQLRYPKNK